VSYSVSQVLDSNPGALDAAAREAQAGAGRIDAQMTSVRSHLATLSGVWGGTASEAAQKEGKDLLRTQEAYRTQLSKLQPVLSEGASTLGGLRSQLQSAVDAAEDWWNVNDDGTVRPGILLATWAALSKGNAIVVQAKQIEVEQNLKLILAKFEAADKNTAAAVRKIGWE
jgi:WXG100 family type VII secretion target